MGQTRPCLADCQAVTYHSIDMVMPWKGGSDVSELAGKATRLCWALNGADVFSSRFE